jgi:hypothetical protein
MRTFLALALAGAASATVVENDLKFMNFMAKWSKAYDTVAEFNKRLVIFMEKEAEIIAHNANTEFTFTLGHNNMSDWTEEEYRQLLGGIPAERLAEA